MNPRDIFRFAVVLLPALLAGCPGPGGACTEPGGCEGDLTAPALSSTVPADLAVDVSPSSEVSLVFSEAMDPASVSLVLTRSGSLASADRIALGSPQWSQGDTAVTFTPASAMVFGKAYTVTVSGTDLAGNPLPDSRFRFTVRAEPDTTPPVLLGSAPLEAAAKVPVAAHISFSFSEPLSRASLEGALSFSPPVSCTFSWFNSDSLFRCDPDQNLDWNTTYTATVSTALKDAAGNALAEPQTITFTTEKEDQVAPVLLSSTPVDAGVGAARTPVITLTFNEAMNQVAVQAAFRISAPVSPAPSSYSFLWNAGGTEVTITPTVTYSYGEQVQWELGTGAVDLSDNPIASAVQRGFQVRRLGSVVLTGETTLDGFVSMGTVNSATTNSYGMIGDNTANYSYRTFLSFALVGAGKVPADAFGIVSATLSVYLMSSSGSPLGLGNPTLDHVHHGTILAFDDWGTTSIGSSFVLTTNTTVGYKSRDVTAAVSDDFLQRSARTDRSQFRIRTGNTDNDGANDWIQLGTAEYNGSGQGPQLSVQYEYP